MNTCHFLCVAYLENNNILTGIFNKIKRRLSGASSSKRAEVEVASHAMLDMDFMGDECCDDSASFYSPESHGEILLLDAEQPAENAPASNQAEIVTKTGERKDKVIEKKPVTKDIGRATQEISDLTQIPKILDRRFEELDKEGAVRPTIINPGQSWTKKAQKALLAEPTSTTLGVDEQKSALSRSGGLTVDHASLHVVIAATHCFDLSLMDTIIKNNVNPIEKVERSTLIMATTVHGRPVGQLVKGDQAQRVLTYTPGL